MIKLTRLFSPFIAIAFLFTGCATTPPVINIDEAAVDKLIAAIERIEEAHDKRHDQPVIETKPRKPDTPPVVAVANDQIPFSDLDWSYGGFHGEQAEFVPGCEIRNLNVSSRGMNYQWLLGGCELLGAKYHDDASCLACLFVRTGGRWKGGKFDWISTSRHTRDFANIHGGYHGWSSADIENADAFAFVIVSRDGRKRTNTIVQEGGAR